MTYIVTLIFIQTIYVMKPYAVEGYVYTIHPASMSLILWV